MSCANISHGIHIEENVCVFYLTTLLLFTPAIHYRVQLFHASQFEQHLKMNTVQTILMLLLNN